MVLMAAVTKLPLAMPSRTTFRFSGQAGTGQAGECESEHRERGGEATADGPVAHGIRAGAAFANSTPKFNLNQFGGSVGGPIQKNETVLLPRLSGEEAAHRHSVHWNRAHTGHDERRLYDGPFQLGATGSEQPVWVQQSC